MSDNVFILNTYQRKCQHVQFEVDESLNIVTCTQCNKELNPMWLVKQMCYEESRILQRINFLHEVEFKARHKTRCKCSHCGHMTKIIR